MRHAPFAAAAAGAALLVAVVAAWAAELPRAPLTVVTADGASHAFTVEVADTPDTRASGLMFRETLGAGSGMLFDFHREGEVHFWMKNTPLPLDMIFIAASGIIKRIEPDTEPYSERVIPSRHPVRYVLEVPAGTAKRLNIAPGDRVESPAIQQAPQ